MMQNEGLQFIDLSYLIDYSEGNKEFMEGMMEQCIGAIPDVIINLKLSLLQKDWKKLREESHKFIPVISFAGFGKIMEDMQKIESISQELTLISDPEKEKGLIQLVLNSVKYCQQALPELVEEYKRMKDEE